LFYDALQFYTFLETTLVTLSLLPHFIAFFSDVEIPGSPAALAMTFLTFGKCITILWIALLYFFSVRIPFCIIHHASTKIVPFLCSAESGFFLECSWFHDYAYFTYFCEYNNDWGKHLVAYCKTVFGMFMLRLICYHVIQAYEKKTNPHWMYDLGRMRNFAQVRLVQNFNFMNFLNSYLLVFYGRSCTNTSLFKWILLSSHDQLFILYL
jgi:hypothetical protein